MACAQCSSIVPEGGYSNRQKKFGEQRRKCHACVAMGVSGSGEPSAAPRPGRSGHAARSGDICKHVGCWRPRLSEDFVLPWWPHRLGMCLPAKTTTRRRGDKWVPRLGSSATFSPAPPQCTDSCPPSPSPLPPPLASHPNMHSTQSCSHSHPLNLTHSPSPPHSPSLPLTLIHSHSHSHSHFHFHFHSLSHTILLLLSLSLSLTHSLTPSPTRSLTHSLTHSLTCARSHSPTHSLTHSLTHALAHPANSVT